MKYATKKTEITTVGPTDLYQTKDKTRWRSLLCGRAALVGKGSTVLLVLRFDPAAHKFSAAMLMMPQHLANKILLPLLVSFAQRDSDTL